LTVEKAGSFAPLTRTSMQLDREKGRATELEALIGYVCEEGAKLKISLPVYESVYQDLKRVCKT
jgi:2-dehydropantoate 2-reductase